MSPEWYGSNFEGAILQHILMIHVLSISGEIDLRWMNTPGFHRWLVNIESGKTVVLI